MALVALTRFVVPILFKKAVVAAKEVDEFALNCTRDEQSLRLQFQSGTLLTILKNQDEVVANYTSKRAEIHAVLATKGWSVHAEFAGSVLLLCGTEYVGLSSIEQIEKKLAELVDSDVKVSFGEPHLNTDWLRLTASSLPLPDSRAVSYKRAHAGSHAEDKRAQSGAHADLVFELQLIQKFKMLFASEDELSAFANGGWNVQSLPTLINKQRKGWAQQFMTFMDVRTDDVLTISSEALFALAEGYYQAVSRYIVTLGLNSDAHAIVRHCLFFDEVIQAFGDTELADYVNWLQALFSGPYNFYVRVAQLVRDRLFNVANAGLLELKSGQNLPASHLLYCAPHQVTEEIAKALEELSPD
jgi:hypothetical protein